MGAEAFDGADLARVQLRLMREQARRAPFRPSGVPVQRRRRGSEPLSLGALVDELAASGRVVVPAIAVVQAKWAEVLGPDLSRHLVPVALDEGSGALHVVADSKAWATQAQLLERQLLARLRYELGGAASGSLRISVGRLPSVVPVARSRPAPVGHLDPPTDDEWLQAARGVSFPGEPLPLGQLLAAPTDEVDHAHEGLRRRLREQLAREQALTAERRREREGLLGLPQGWLDGPKNLNPRPVSDQGQLRWVEAVLAAAKRRARASREAGGRV